MATTEHAPPFGLPEPTAKLGVNGPAAFTTRVAMLPVQKLDAFFSEAISVKLEPDQS